MKYLILLIILLAACSPLKEETLTESRCTSGMSLLCDSVTTEGNQITIKLNSPVDQDITKISLEGCNVVSGTGTYSSGDIFEIVLNCDYDSSLVGEMSVTRVNTISKVESISSIGVQAYK